MTHGSVFWGSFEIQKTLILDIIEIFMANGLLNTVEIWIIYGLDA